MEGGGGGIPIPLSVILAFFNRDSLLGLAIMVISGDL